MQRPLSSNIYTQLRAEPVRVNQTALRNSMFLSPHVGAKVKSLDTLHHQHYIFEDIHLIPWPCFKWFFILFDPFGVLESGIYRYQFGLILVKPSVSLTGNQTPNQKHQPNQHS